MKNEITKKPPQSLLSNPVFIDFVKYVQESKEIHHGEVRQVIIRFKNNHGISLLQGIDTFGDKIGRYEIAILRFNDGDDKSEFIDAITGGFNSNECIELFNKVKSLPADSSIEIEHDRWWRD